MLNLKRIFVNILASLILILSLGTMSACVGENGLNVYQVPFEDAYIYNGEKYVVITDERYIYGSMDTKRYQIGYAYPVYIFVGIPLRIKVYMYDNDTEGTVIFFDNSCGNQYQYVKEGVQFPDDSELMDIEFLGLNGRTLDGVQENYIDFKFKLRDVLSKEVGPESLTNDWKNQAPSYWKPNGRMFYGYLSDYPLTKPLGYVFDDQNNVYVYCVDAWHKVIDDEFKQFILQIKEEDDRLSNS